MKTQKCCVHCPGKLVPPGSNESHECCQPRYISGNLRISSLNKHIPDCSRKRDVKESLVEPLPENRLSCYDHFATAKKLHAENLMHQPLPDKVADCVFKNVKPGEIPNEHLSEKCCKQEVEGHSMKLNKRYGPVLGCKAPKTKIDLAICWETPINPVYEPPRPTHIDGTEGGLAPAIFTLVQHNSNSRASVCSETAKNKNESLSQRNQKCKSQEDLNYSGNENKKNDNKNMKSRDCPCNKLNGVDISSKNQGQEQSRRSFRKCVACETKNTKDDPRLIRSAVGLALGTEKTINGQRDGSKSTIPRPKTPFARKSFCIDTLTPPFSITNGCRNIDFPEHWRLMSVYQQSYRNPYRRRIYRC
ncbi:hypothetical protein WN48_05115 [Eufriesea mexicana]|uniref:uncharacterized protein LOC108556051 n=1 Tax=Eufriesea mexicana TaxID=516756 RepID=UPI00083C412B|nr:PREDICTED: uncharacterized protein LOC108556051 [Eufriesea mexicana]OAD60598.1 hypothetical protein WN48_05115 [Eufriesea mexicana]